MKVHKSPLRFALFFALIFGVNLAFAEESGVFVGLEIGGGEISAKSTMISFQTNALKTIDFDTGFKPTYYGLIAGYKQFFTNYLGLRYYANINALHFALNPKDCGGEGCANFSLYDDIAMISYGANIDFMGNFYSNESVDFGGFVGLGLGANSWVGKGLDNHKGYIALLNKWYRDTNRKTPKLEQTSFDCWVNLGLRTNFATHHSIEAVARVPLMTNTLIKDNFVGYGETHTNIRNIYSVSIRYALIF